jgi:hypothetical protein
MMEVLEQMKKRKIVFGGLLNTVKTEDNTYKVRITNHIRNN